MKDFEKWWENNWTPMQPAVLNEAFKEISKRAWDAGQEEAFAEAERIGEVSLFARNRQGT